MASVLQNPEKASGFARVPLAAYKGRWREDCDRSDPQQLIPDTINNLLGPHLTTRTEHATFSSPVTEGTEMNKPKILRPEER